MAPKKKASPIAGQRSIAAFFSSGPKPAQAGQDAAAAAATPAAKLVKPADGSDVGAAKQAAAAAPQLPTVLAAKPAAKPAAAAPPAGPAAVGKNVSVYWADEDAWFTGVIKEYSGASGKFLIECDDGDEAWEDLTAAQFKWVRRPAAKPSATAHKDKAAGAQAGGKENSKAAAAGRKRKAAVVESEGSEGEEASGSEYAASSAAEESSDDEASLAEEESEEEEDEGSDTSPLKGKKGSRAAARAPARKAAAGGRGKGGKAAATPIAVPTGSVGLTPGSNNQPALNNVFAALAAGARTASTVARPPRPSLPAKTPGSTAGGSVSRTLNATPSAYAEGEEPGSTLRGEAAPRFPGKVHESFPFLHPDRIRDAQRRRPDDPVYDARTLYVPPEWLKANKVSPGQLQWWEFKARNMDAVLLFKMGKFYELFEMDAHTAVEALGLSYMKGEKPHAGFPEAAYHLMAEKLARAGHKVVVVEQTENPEMLKARNEERLAQGLKKDGVVRREKVAVLTQGTLTDAEMLAGQPEAAYLMALAELPVPDALMAASEHTGAPPTVWIGACACDAATGQLLLGQWLDDEMRSQLRAVLTAVQPVELVLPRGDVSPESLKVVRGILRAPRINQLPLGAEEGEFWDAHTVWSQLDGGAYFPANAALPPALAATREGAEGQAAAAHALGGCLSYLRECLLDKQVLAACRVEQLAETFGIGAGLAGGAAAAAEAAGPLCMALDGAALENLEVLENSEGTEAGTLLAAINNCVTPAGRRRLRQWLCRPLYRIPDIVARQDAIADLMGAAEEAAATARTLFKGVADLERALARINAAGQGVGSVRDAPHVILYEDVSKRRVQAYASALRGLQKIQDGMAAFAGMQGTLSSELLLRVVTPGELFPDMRAALAEMQSVTDWAEAEATGRVEPAEGVDAAYDAAVEGIRAAEQALKDYLQEAKRAVGSGVKVQYVSLNKDSHVLEVPEGAKVPASWEPCASKKGVKRYMSADLRDLVKAREAAYDAKEKAQGGILQGMMCRFAGRKALWDAAVDCMAQLDALMSLAVAAACGSGTMCRPTLVPWSPADGGAPIFRARGLRHPAGVSGRDGTFVPNDIVLGGPDSPPFIVLTGPNMGGKSTLMRQVCLAALMAQVGAYVPAESLEVTPADAVFVRMGARDRIMLGQSTFFVELSETSAALHRATPASLVILDELGRGTSTGDGAAIAAAVLDHLAHSVGCRGMFATHYHHISDSHAADPRVALQHMGCAVTPAAQAGGVEEVTFLYRLTAGACPKSYGANVARLAGLPNSVVYRAALKAAESEAARQEGGEGMDVDAGGSGGEAAALLGRVRAACHAAAGGDAAAAADVLRLQREVRQLLQLG